MKVAESSISLPITEPKQSALESKLEDFALLTKLPWVETFAVTGTLAEVEPEDDLKREDAMYVASVDGYICIWLAHRGRIVAWSHVMMRIAASLEAVEMGRKLLQQHKEPFQRSVRVLSTPHLASHTADPSTTTPRCSSLTV
jgi:hypothetical protein